MTVVVVEQEPEEPAESTPVAVAEAVTPGELAARLELLESNLGDRISQAVQDAYEARIAAENAQETADVAAVIAAVAAEEAAPEPDEVDGGEGPAEDEEEGGVRAPQRRQEQSADEPAGRSQAPKKKADGYGASWLSGR